MRMMNLRGVAMLVALACVTAYTHPAAQTIRLRTAGVTSGGGGDPVGNGYTVTHLVVPYTSVAGATADTDDMGSSAWTAAANDNVSEVPTTIGTALVRATAGNIVEMAPGYYSGSWSGHSGSEPVFVGSADGSSGNPIIFTAQYPAAYNATDDTKWTQFGKDADQAPPHDIPPTPPAVWGIRSYVVLDGIYMAYGEGAYPSGRGQIHFLPTFTGGEVRRFLADRTDLGTGDDGDNYDIIQIQGHTDAKVRDSRFRNGFDTLGTGNGSGGSHNESVFTMYGATNFLVENCWFENVTSAIYIKGGNAGVGNTGIVRYNFIDRVDIGVEIATGPTSGSNTVRVTQNVMTGSSVSVENIFGFDNATDFMVYAVVDHNTLISNTSAEDISSVAVDAGVEGNNSEFRDNIVARFSSTSRPTVASASALTNFVSWNYNLYYENGNTVQYEILSSGILSSLASWRTACSCDANSIEGDPLFVNQASGNYRLSGSSPALTASSTAGPLGAYITGSEEIGLRASPTY